MLWPKGMDRLIPMMVYARERDGRTFTLDAYGSGPDEGEIKRKALARNLTINFHGAVDHATLSQYKVYIYIYWGVLCVCVLIDPRLLCVCAYDRRTDGPPDYYQPPPQKQVFINPSVSEVLCTTVAEALAMGKFVIIADHPSNEFFMRFTNCLTFRNKEVRFGFV